MTIQIIKYQEQYWEDICRIHDAARKAELAYASLKEAFLPLEAVAVEEGLFEYKHLDVAVEDGQAVGFCAYSEEELAWLYVSPEKMRNGIGKQLALHAMAEEKALCYVETLRGNEPARRLYESLGFKIREILTGKMPGNEQFSVQVYSMFAERKL
ncbi:MAG: GNAT family N-acetyltransferase [Acetatifactor sp.]|nr:GNAT family N-acetyltransferase [Acetatifactor sp.]